MQSFLVMPGDRIRARNYKVKGGSHNCLIPGFHQVKLRAGVAIEEFPGRCARWEVLRATNRRVSGLFPLDE